MSLTFLDMVANELAPELRERPWDTPGELAHAIDRTTIQTKALDVIDAALVAVADGECSRLIVNMPPQEGKSSRVSRSFPLWMLARNPNLRIAIVSADFTLARTFGSRIRDDLDSNRDRIGLQLSESTRAKHEFQVLGYRGGVYCVGVTGSLTGRPVDLMIIDDPYKDSKQAESAAWRQTVRDFWTEVAVPRLAPGAPVVLVQTRWREDDLAGWLQESGDGWRVINIPAQADHRPEQGEVDVLDRQPGEYLDSARQRSDADWEKTKREAGTRSWTALYQGRPAPLEGSLLLRHWWQTYEQPQWVERSDGSRTALHFDELIASWDLTFKDGEGTDLVVGQVWGRRGVDAYLLDQVRARMDFPRTLREFQTLAARWPQATLKIVEDKANGPALIASLQHSVFGIVPEVPQGSKVARAAAVAPLVEAGNVFLPAPAIAPWVGDLIDEAAAFPHGKHDDQVDAMSQALNRLILQPLLTGDGLFTEDDFEDDLAGFSISPL